jgi:hypothetical protein
VSFTRASAFRHGSGHDDIQSDGISQWSEARRYLTELNNHGVCSAGPACDHLNAVQARSDKPYGEATHTVQRRHSAGTGS